MATRKIKNKSRNRQSRNRKSSRQSKNKSRKGGGGCWILKKIDNNLPQNNFIQLHKNGPKFEN